MSKIDQLIRKLCPSGVPFKTLVSVAEYIRGVTYSKENEVPADSRAVKVLRANNISLSTNTLNFDDVKHISDTVKIKEQQKLKGGDILICAASGSKDHVGKVAFIKDDINYVFGGFMAVLRTKEELSSRFLFHLLVGNTFSKYLDSALNTTTINNLSTQIISGFLIPIPPLAVQAEIVRILDTFTALEAELEAELEARRKQYEYYRNQLLSFNECQNGWGGAG